MFADVESNEETLQRAIANLVAENAFMKRRIDDLLQENTKYKLENERLNNIINELEKDIKNLYTYGIKNNAEQRDYLLNRLEGLKKLKENK